LNSWATENEPVSAARAGAATKSAVKATKTNRTAKRIEMKSEGIAACIA